LLASNSRMNMNSRNIQEKREFKILK